jgi:very-short-patch-repair endonuclease
MPDRPLQSRARSMRLAPTPAERAVWRILRAAPFDALHFRRQVPFAQRYIADFASHRARVIIEIDGGTHDPESQAEQARTAWLAAQGYRMLRFNNSDVAEADIARALIAALAPVLPPPPGERSEPRVGRVGVGVVERGRRLGFKNPHPSPPHSTLRVGGGSSLPPPPR